MEPTRIAIVSTSGAAADELAEGLRRVGFERPAERLTAFPSRGELRDLLRGAQPVEILLLDYSDEQPALECLREVRAIRDMNHQARTDSRSPSSPLCTNERIIWMSGR